MPIIFTHHQHNQVTITWKGFQAVADLYQRGVEKTVYAQVTGQSGTGYLALQANKNTPGTMDGSAIGWDLLDAPAVQLVAGVPQWK